MKRLFTEPQRKAVPPEETIRRIREILSNRDLLWLKRHFRSGMALTAAGWSWAIRRFSAGDLA